MIRPSGVLKKDDINNFHSFLILLVVLFLFVCYIRVKERHRSAKNRGEESSVKASTSYDREVEESE